MCMSKVGKKDTQYISPLPTAQLVKTYLFGVDLWKAQVDGSNLINVEEHHSFVRRRGSTGQVRSESSEFF
jgi:hypothetical protein